MNVSTVASRIQETNGEESEEYEEAEERSPPQKEVKVLYTNAQSLPSKITELDAVASDLQPDIILICESWCNSNISEANLNINGYELHKISELTEVIQPMA